MPEETTEPIESQQPTAESFSTDDAGLEAGSADAGQQTGSDDEWKSKHDAAVAQARDEKRKRQELEARLQNMEQMLAIKTANPPQTPQATTLYEQVANEMGYGDEPYHTAQQQGQILQEVTRRMNAAQQANTFIASHPDYFDVVGRNVNGTFIPSDEIVKIVNDAKAIGNDGPYMQAMSGPAGAYNLVMQHRELQRLRELSDSTKNRTKQAEIEQQIHNHTAPMSPGSGAGATRTVKPEAITTKEEADEIRRRIMAGEFDT